MSFKKNYKYMVQLWCQDLMDGGYVHDFFMDEATAIEQYVKNCSQFGKKRGFNCHILEIKDVTPELAKELYANQS